MQVLVFRHMQGQDLRQTLVTIGLSIVIADLMLWICGAEIYTSSNRRAWLYGSTAAAAGRRSSRPTGSCVLARGIVIGVGLWLLLTARASA